MALSRARHHTTIHATADGIEQAVDDLQADWGIARHQRWISHTPATVGTLPDPDRADTVDVTDKDESPPTSNHLRREEAEARLAALRHELRDLHAGTGRWQDTLQGAAARHLAQARLDLARTQQLATHPALRRRDRRAAARQLDEVTQTVAAAERNWQRIGQPHLDKCLQAIVATNHIILRSKTEEILQHLGEAGPVRTLAPDTGFEWQASL